MATVDVLAFGPHPDDLEIGLGGTLAKHAALGQTVLIENVTGASGTIVSTLKPNGTAAPETLPAASVAVALTVWPPCPSVVRLAAVRTPQSRALRPWAPRWSPASRAIRTMIAAIWDDHASRGIAAELNARVKNVAT